MGTAMWLLLIWSVGIPLAFGLVVALYPPLLRRRLSRARRAAELAAPAARVIALSRAQARTASRAAGQGRPASLG
jgi:hypothetical protein